MNPELIPFSIPGSYLALSRVARGNEIIVRNLDQSAAEAVLISVTFDWKPDRWSFDGTCIQVAGPDGIFEITFADPCTLHYRTSAPARFVPRKASQLIPWGDARYELSLPRQNTKLVLFGSARLEGRQVWDGDNATEVELSLNPGGESVEGCVRVPEAASPNWDPPSAFAHSLGRLRAAAEQWDLRLNPGATPMETGSHLARYLLWSAQVPPRGHLSRRAILVSTNWMSRVWTWDNCFHALGVWFFDPELAWNQIMLPFDAQSDEGAIPDSLIPSRITWYSAKPPIYGWILRWLDDRGLLTDRHRMEIYAPLLDLTRWWIGKDTDGNGVPEYFNGNESGWDNSTSFIPGVPVESPDLLALLIVQCDQLVDLGQRLGQDTRWQSATADRLRAHLATTWTGQAYGVRTVGQPGFRESTSLLSWIPLVLKGGLDPDHYQRLVESLQEFEVPVGLASEKPAGPWFEDDSYWRGPVWAPPMLLILDALWASHPDYARGLTSRYVVALARSGTMPENLSSLDGRPLRDPSVNWTSAVYLVLRRYYLGES